MQKPRPNNLKNWLRLIFPPKGVRRLQGDELQDGKREEVSFNVDFDERDET